MLSFFDAKWIMIFIIVWALAGITAFIMSLVCLSKPGTVGSKIIGFILAIFFGPFYWLYYYLIPRGVYC